jgi:uncharacterized damage-inducible protein DinB
MDVAALLGELFDRIPPLVERAVEALPPDRLASPPGDEANTIAWLVWHLTRIEDDHVADAAGRSQVWEDGGWPERFGLPTGAMDTGYGHSSTEVRSVVASADDLVAYHRAVAERTAAFLDGLGPEDLDRVVDEGWDPPVTLGVRLVSVASDALQHAGQAAYVRGLLT